MPLCQSTIGKINSVYVTHHVSHCVCVWLESNGDVVWQVGANQNKADIQQPPLCVWLT